MNHPLRTALAAALAGVLLLALGAEAPAASVTRQFNKAWQAFHQLDKNPSRAKLRSQWEIVEREFKDVYKMSPNGPYAPKALYYLGRVSEELGLRSGLKGDFQRAVDYYGRVAARWPDHSWTDDCLLKKARIELKRLDRPDRAYADLFLLTHRYPDGDMHDEAEALLTSMDKKQATALAPKKSAPKPAVEAPKQQTAAAAPAPAPDPDAYSGGQSKHRELPKRDVTLERVRFQSSNDYTRVVLDLEDEVPFKWQMLPPNKEYERPHRLYVDLEGARLSGDLDSAIDISDGILKKVRSGQFDPHTARVVMDFNDMQEYKIFQLYNPFRVVVDIYAPERTSSLSQPLVVAKKDMGSAVTSKKPAKPEKYTPPKGSKQLVGDLVEQLGLTVDTIMLDPGHGGKDPGAHANGLLEKDVTLRLAKIVGAKLEAKGFHVLYTRKSDKFIPLEERTAMANVQGADMFISLHCNAIRDKRVHGMETYTLNLARTEDAVRVAARENAISTKRISDLQVILTDLMLNSKVRESKDLAGRVQSLAVKNVRSKYSVRDRNVREAPFYVLMGAKMPSVLVEIGYITNPTEAKRMRSESYLDRLADGIVSGVVEYKKDIERYASL